MLRMVVGLSVRTRISRDIVEGGGKEQSLGQVNMS